MPEKFIEALILDWLRLQPNCFAFKVNQAGYFDPKKQKFTTHKNRSIKGVSDIVGIWHGKPLAIEVKSRKGKLSEFQSEFLYKFAKAGGISILARSLDDVMNILVLGFNQKNDSH